jgi:hypothetical protein
MTTTTQTKSFTASTVSSVLQAKPHQIGEIAEDVSQVAELIRSGRAFLKVVAYPWGVEFEVCGQEGEI